MNGGLHIMLQLPFPCAGIPGAWPSIQTPSSLCLSFPSQFTIPQKYYAQVGFGKEAECLLTRDAIIIRPIAANQGGELAESILADLIAQGLSGQELLEAFRKKQAQVAPAVKDMLSDARKVAKGNSEKFL